MKQQPDESNIRSWHVVKFLFKESFKEKRLVLAMAFAPISALAIGTAIPYLVSTILAKLAQGNLQSFAREGIVLLVITATVGVVANRVSFLSLLKSQAYTLERLQNEIFDSLLAKDRRYFANRMSGKLVSDVLALQSSMIQFQDQLAISALPLTLNLVFGIILVFINSWVLGLGLLIISTLVVSSAVFYSSKRAPMRLERHRLRRELHGYFADVITNNNAVKIFANESIEKKTHKQLNSKFTAARVRDWTMVSIDSNNRIILILALQVIFIALTIFMVQKNPSLLNVGIFAFTFTIFLSNKLFDISSTIKGIENAITDSAAAVNILENQPQIVDTPNAKDLEVNNADIEFQDVDFRYSDNKSNELLFQGLNLKVKSGEKIGLVGHSGGGKTTITNLLLRFNDIDGGKILIDGQDIKEVTQQSLRQNIAYVPQEPLLFHRSLHDNIAYGKPGASEAEIKKFAKLAQADNFIEKLPDKYDTLVGERGVKLSGGQRQRIAIARAMIKDAPILVLDEATSALDSESEVYIQKALWKLMEGRTAIVIAHRLSTIQKMDRIVVMDEGKIVEQGTHRELIANKGIYAELWNHQSGGFIDE